MRSRKFTARLIGLAGVGIVWADTASTQPNDLDTSIIADNQEATYQRCLNAAAVNPEAGMDMALRWRNLNGGEPAQHCMAVAMMMIGDSEAAAPLLDSLAISSSATAPVRAGLFRQAAQAWMAEADYNRALSALEKAQALLDREASIFVDLAVVHAALNDYWAAVDALNAALDLDPSLADALVLRGSAYRRLAFPSLASDDLQRALASDPENLDALLELGLLAREQGDNGAARQHWIRVLEIAPESSAADAVRQHLAEMDVSRDP